MAVYLYGLWQATHLLLTNHQNSDMKTWRPNASGTFSNRISVHDKEDKKLFVVEYYMDSLLIRKDITGLICGAPELLAAAKDFVNKVDTGKARSTDSYNKFKSAIEAIENL